MRRILSLLAIAAVMAMMLALMAGPALADAREPTFDGPGNPQAPDPEENPAVLTESAGKNCYGQLNSNNLKGPGGNPGSLAEPTEFPEGTPNYTGHAVSTLPSGEISEFQQDFREDAAAQSC